MALSSVRSARATRKQTHGLAFRRIPLSRSAERHQPPLIKPTPSDPKRPDSLVKAQDVSGEQSTSSVLDKDPFDNAPPEDYPYDNEALAMGDDTINDETSFGERRDASGGKVLVVKKPTPRQGARQATRDMKEGQSGKADALVVASRDRNQGDKGEQVELEDKPKVIVAKRPVMKRTERRETEASAVKEPTEMGITKEDDRTLKEAAQKVEGLKAKRDGNVLIVKQSMSEGSSLRNKRVMSKTDITEMSLNASDVDNKDASGSSVRPWWADATVEKMEEVEKLKELENGGELLKTTMDKQETKVKMDKGEKSKVIKRPRPHAPKPILMERPRVFDGDSDATSGVFLPKKQTSNPSIALQSEINENEDHSLNIVGEEIMRETAMNVDQKPRVIERRRPKPMTAPASESQASLHASTASTLLSKQPMPTLLAIPNDAEEFLRMDALKEEEMQLPVGDIDFSVGASSDVTPLGGNDPSSRLDDTFEPFEEEKNEDIKGPVLPAETSRESPQLSNDVTAGTNSEKESGMPSLTSPNRMTTQTSDSDAMLPEEEEGMRIREALLKDIQQKRQNNEEESTKKTETGDVRNVDSTPIDFQSTAPEEPVSAMSVAKDDDMDSIPLDSDDGHASLSTEMSKDEETSNRQMPMEDTVTAADAWMPAMDSQSMTSPTDAAMNETVDNPEETKSEDVKSEPAVPQMKAPVPDPSSQEDDQEEAPSRGTTQPPELKLQGPPKNPEVPPRTPVSSIQSKETMKMDTTTRPGQVMSPSQAPTDTSNMTAATESQDQKSSKPSLTAPLKRRTSPTWQSKDGKTSPRKVHSIRARTPQRPRPMQKPTPVLVKKPSKGEHSKSNNIALDRQIMKEKEQTKRKETKLKIEEERAMNTQLRKQKPTEKRQKKARKSDPVLIESRRKARVERQQKRIDAEEDDEGETIIEVGAEGLSVEELGYLLAMKPAEVMKVLFMKGVMVTVNQVLDMDSVKVVAAEAGVMVVDKDEVALTEMAVKQDSMMEEEDSDAVQRPPVVTVMGHVDHGKTTLLDYIRQTQVALGEAGGITQAIGAYTCTVEIEGKERTVCFLDTPGHEAFSAMRARGTRVTDIAVIIVAADDGLRPQTREAIDHAKAAHVPIVVAINKIDVPGADPERVKRELSEIEMLPEEWGGQTPVVQISAKTGEGVNALLEMLTLVADIQLNLKANSDVAAKGTVIEAFLDKRSGTMATVLVQSGTLHVGDAIVAGAAFGKVRSMMDASGNHVTTAGPSIAVQLLGFHDLPSAGDIFTVCQDESQAKDEAERASEELRRRHLAEAAGGGSMVTLSSLASVDDDDDDAVILQRINLVLKANTVGSLEAAKGVLAKLPQDSVMIRYLHAAAGEVTESDVLLAAAADGLVIGFNASINESIKAVAKQQGVELRSYSVIYDLIDDVRNIMEGKLQPAEDRLAIGQADVRAVFGSGSQKVAGCMVTEGRLEKDCFIRVIRKKTVQFEGILNSLRRVKDKVESIDVGLECGVGCDAYSEWQEGDRIEAFTLVQKRATLEETHAVTAVDHEEFQRLRESSDDA